MDLRKPSSDDSNMWHYRRPRHARSLSWPVRAKRAFQPRRAVFPSFSRVLFYVTAALTIWRVSWLMPTTSVSNDPNAVSQRKGDTKSSGQSDQAAQAPRNAMVTLDPLVFAKEAFPPHEYCEAQLNRSAQLPDIVFEDFEDAVEDQTLEGWEDAWVSKGIYDSAKWQRLAEPKIDFVFTWVNGSDEAFSSTKARYAANSTRQDSVEKFSGVNRYRDWEELRYSIRSIEKYAPFRNKIQILVNSVQRSPDGKPAKQMPGWLSQKSRVRERVQVLAQEDFFAEDKRGCLPTFNSLTMENQIYNTASNTDRVFALSDDMLLGKAHTASDLFSPLFGTVMSFKTNAYNTRNMPTEADAQRFGEKPWLIYTSWLLNRRFGERKRRGQAHFGHSLSRKTMKEALSSFPGPELQSAGSRFRGDIVAEVSGFQMYAWYLYFHYTMERHRETLLWSYLAIRADADGDGTLSWDERIQVIADVQQGMENLARSGFRFRNFLHVPQLLESAGLPPPRVNTDVQWTAMDGPWMGRDAECAAFDVNECLAHGFNAGSHDPTHRNPFFSTAALFRRVAHQVPACGDCLVKILLYRAHRGLGPLLPHKKKQAAQREMIVKALMKYQYIVVEPDALFVMVTDAEQVETTLFNRFIRRAHRVGQLCLNDDVATDDEHELQDTKNAMTALYEGLFPEKSPYEKKNWP